MTNAKHSKRRSGGGAAGIHFGIYIFIGLVVAALLALMGFFVMRKIRNRRGEIGDAKQNATRDHSEAVNKLEADGSVLHGALAQFARAPNATLQQQQQQQQQQQRKHPGTPVWEPRRPRRLFRQRLWQECCARAEL